MRELKIVQSVSRHGSDTLTAEEVQTPNRKTPTTSRNNCSSSPTKRLWLESFDYEPIPFDPEGPDVSEKRQTMVVIFFMFQ